MVIACISSVIGENEFSFGRGKDKEKISVIKTLFNIFNIY